MRGPFAAQEREPMIAEFRIRSARALRSQPELLGLANFVLARLAFGWRQSQRVITGEARSRIGDAAATQQRGIICQRRARYNSKRNTAFIVLPDFSAGIDRSEKRNQGEDYYFRSGFSKTSKM